MPVIFTYLSYKYIFFDKLPKLYLHSQIREHSSVGLEHLPYKQRVRGSNPCAPTNFSKGFKRLKPFFMITAEHAERVYNL